MSRWFWSGGHKHGNRITAPVAVDDPSHGARPGVRGRHVDPAVEGAGLGAQEPGEDQGSRASRGHAHDVALGDGSGSPARSVGLYLALRRCPRAAGRPSELASVLLGIVVLVAAGCFAVGWRAAGLVVTWSGAMSVWALVIWQDLRKARHENW